MYVSMHVCMRVYMYVHVIVYVYLYMYACVYVYTYIYIPSIQYSCLTWIYLEFKLVFSLLIW